MLTILSEELWFPDAEEALPDGLLAMGGDLSEERILLAYRNGIFPWYESWPILWWSPNPRLVLFPENLKVSKSMKVLLKKNAFEFTINQAFEQVINACAATPRSGQNSTWLNENMIEAYTQLHKKGWAMSAEVWKADKLQGGLYGILIGKVFFGESMFSRASNASKYAFIKMVEWLKQQGVVLIDCQVYTDHLVSLGAEEISRKKFMEILKNHL